MNPNLKTEKQSTYTKAYNAWYIQTPDKMTHTNWSTGG